MNGTTPSKQQGFFLPPARPLIILATTGLSIALIFSVVPVGGHDGVLDVNNMSCAHLVGGQERAETSGFFFQDFPEPRTRLDCSYVFSPAGLFDVGYSVAPGQEPHLRAELYLSPEDEMEQVQGAVCLTWENNQNYEDWNCGPVETSTSYPTPEQFWDSVHRPLPAAPVPDLITYQVGFSSSGSGTPSTISNEGNLLTYTGAILPVANITDLWGNTIYDTADSLKNWTLLDPDGTDRLEVNGSPLTLTSGTSLTFTEHDVKVTYDSTPNDPAIKEWIIESTDASETVFLWYNGDAKWTIYKLDY